MPAHHISVTCPACGQAFLALQVGAGAAQSCPHCSYCTQLASFHPTSGVSPTLGNPLPPVRRCGPGIQQPAASRPANSPSPYRESVSEPVQPHSQIAPTWTPMKPSSMPGAFLTTPATNGLQGGQSFIVTRGRRFPWLSLVLSLGLAGGAAALVIAPMLKESEQNTARAAMPEQQIVGTALESVEPESPIRQYPMLPECQITLDESKAKVEGLLADLCAAQTPEQRLACIANAEQLRQSMAEYFVLNPKPMGRAAFRILPAPARLLPGRHETYIFEAKTNDAEHGTTLLRLTGPSVSALKLDWELLQDSHSGALTSFLKDPVAKPRWISLAVKRSFGFSESVGIRDSCHVFDIQGTADGMDRTVALCPKDSAFGRALDRAVAWNDLYIMRVLVGWSPIAGNSRLTLLDGKQMPGL